jgi:hypothetical protein
VYVPGVSNVFEYVPVACTGLLSSVPLSDVTLCGMAFGAAGQSHSTVSPTSTVIEAELKKLFPTATVCVAACAGDPG